MEQLTKEMLADIRRRFSDDKNKKNRENKNTTTTPRSIVVMENKSLDFSEDKYKTLSLYSVLEPFIDINFLKDGVLLDICFDNYLSQNIDGMFGNMDLYSELAKQTQYPILNVISLVLSTDEDNQEQLKFVNPKFYDKFSNTVGRPINGIRLMYDVNNVMYIPDSSEADKMLDELNGLIVEDDENEE